jgi:hypothetical protein
MNSSDMREIEINSPERKASAYIPYRCKSQRASEYDPAKDAAVVNLMQVLGNAGSLVLRLLVE